MVARQGMRRVWLVAVALASLGSVGARAQGTKGMSFQQGHGPRFLIEVNGQQLNEWTVLSLPDTIVLTISSLDSLGNSIPLVGYEVQVWDQSVLGLVGSSIEASRAVTKFVPKKRGQTTVQIRAAGIRQWVLVEVGPTTFGIGPEQAPLAGGGGGGGGPKVWTAGFRGSWASYNYDFLHQTTINGRSGFVGEGYIGRVYPSGLELVLGAGFGVLKADSAGVSITARELELYVRGDYAFLRDKKVRPVVSLGVGAYRIRTGGVTPGVSDPGIWNTSLFFVAGAGVDATVGEKMVAEFRVSTQQLYEVTSGHADGYVGNLLLIGAGLRFQF